jgi:Protein of unknown function (DUF732)
MKVLLPIAAALASATTLAATAHADPNDAQFLQNVRDGMGLEITDGPALINTAHELCTEMKERMSYEKVLSTVRQGNLYLNVYQTDFFVRVSAQAYCPELVASE